MPIWLRISVLASCMAIGVAVALALALQSPASQSGRQESPPPLAAQQAAPTTVSTPVIVPYRDPVAQQVNQLGEALQQIEQSSQRREKSLLRAIEAVQDQLDAPPSKTAAEGQSPGDQERADGTPENIP